MVHTRWDILQLKQVVLDNRFIHFLYKIQSLFRQIECKGFCEIIVLSVTYAVITMH